jgi:hypothetical protein
MGFAVVHGGGSFKLVASQKLLGLAKSYNILSASCLTKIDGVFF